MKNIIKLLTFIILQFCFITYGHAQTKKDNTLIDAVKQNNTSLAEKLINNGANVNAVDSNLATPLMWAAYTGNLSIFKYLVQKGADYKKKGVIYLDSTKQSYYGNIMGMAAAKNDTLLLAYCLDSLKIPVDDKEYDPETKQVDGWTPLDWAASSGSLEATKILVNHNADINEAYAKDGNTPLLYAAGANKSKLIIYLCSVAGINFNAQNKDGWQLLHYIALDYDMPEFIKKIVEGGANINAQTNTGLTPLMLAAYSGNTKSCLSLLNLNADATLLNKGKKTAHDIAFANGKYETVLCLEKWNKGYGPQNLQILQDSIQITNHFLTLGDSCRKIQRYDCSINNLKLYVTYCRRIYGEKHPAYATSLNNLAYVYDEMGRYEKALPLYQQALQIRKEVFGERHQNYAASLNNLAYVYDMIGSYKKALPLFQQALQIRKDVFGEKNLAYAGSLNNLAALYDEMGNYEKALPLYQQALQIYKEVLGEINASYATALNNLAALYDEMGNYEKALPLFQQALQIRKEVLGEKHSEYAVSLISVASAYNAIGNYEKALPLFQQALQIQKEVLGEKHPAYATSLNYLAGIYDEMGNYEKALTLYQQALQIRKELFGEKHPDYAASLYSVATVYTAMGNYKKALPLYQQALQIRKQVLGEKHPDYAASVNSLAFGYADMGDYEKALPLYQQALQIYKDVFGKEHPKYSISLNNLATLYYKMGNYEKALPLFQQALQTIKKVLGEKHPYYATFLSSLAAAYYNENHIQKAVELTRQYISIVTENLLTGGKFLSNADMMHFINKNYFDLESSNSLAITSKSEPLYAEGLQTELDFKGIVLQNSKDLFSIINQNSDSDLKQLVDQFITTRNQLSVLYKKNAPSKEVDSALAIFDKQEQQLIQLSPEYQQMVKNRNVQWQQVQQKLQSNEAAIEFVDFQYWDKRWTDTTMYAAFLLLPKGQPQMVALCNKKLLEQRINDTLDKNEIYVKKLYQVKDRGVTVESNQKDTVPGLYRLVWQPLDSLLTGINTIYYAPAGLLNRINIAAINYSGNKVLGDKYVFHLMGSTRDLVNYKSERIDNTADTLLLYGGIQFNMDSASLAQQHNKYFSTPTLSDGLATRSGNYFNWPPIEGSAEELVSIEALADSQKIPTHSFTQKQATEESFIYYTHQTKSPAIIHIATHGFFYPDQQRRRLNEEGKDAPYFMSSVNTLERSGIVFAGANQVTSGKAPIQGIEDGIVTAGDISNTNLQNTKLMVLSACETGLGKIENTEGVFGLQRGIRMAGCKNLLMSLWKVPDEQTARFMNYFYTQLLQDKKTIYESYQYAQKQMRELYGGQPYFWAGFVLME